MGEAQRKRALRLRRGVTYQEVPLGGDSVIRLRPATRFDLEEAGALVARDFAAIVLGDDAAARVAAVLGPDFDRDGTLFPAIKAAEAAQADAEAEPALPAQNVAYVAASKFLGDIHLVMACQGGWDHFELVECDGDNQTVTPLDRPEPWSIALLLRDPVLHDAMFKVINSRVHAEIAEGEGLPVSPVGGAGIPAGAPTADGSAKPAPSAD